MKKQLKSSKINDDLAQMVINLHASGYVFDFQNMENQFICLQNNRTFPTTSVEISRAGHYYDQLSRSYKYMYAIDTNNGVKGLMLSNKSLMDKASSTKKVRFPI